MKLHITVTAAALSMLVFGAFAQTPVSPSTPKIDARQARQETRIDQGVSSGAVTQPEARRLDAQQGRISRVENRAKADGTVTKGEAAHITHLQDKASRDIKRQKHDHQKVASKQ